LESTPLKKRRGGRISGGSIFRPPIAVLDGEATQTTPEATEAPTPTPTSAVDGDGGHDDAQDLEPAPDLLSFTSPCHSDSDRDSDNEDDDEDEAQVTDYSVAHHIQALDDEIDQDISWTLDGPELSSSDDRDPWSDGDAKAKASIAKGRL